MRETTLAKQYNIIITFLTIVDRLLSPNREPFVCTRFVCDLHSMRRSIRLVFALLRVHLKAIATQNSGDSSTMTFLLRHQKINKGEIQIQSVRHSSLRSSARDSDGFVFKYFTKKKTKRTFCDYDKLYYVR